MARSRSGIALIVALLAAVAWLAWFLVEGGRQRAEAAVATPPAARVEPARPLAELELDPAPSSREPGDPAPAVVAEPPEATAEPASDGELSWFGKIVDGETERPLAGARVEVVAGNPFLEHTGVASATSAAHGLVQLPFPSQSGSYARVELDGYAPGFAAIEPGNASLAAVLTLRLLRAAALEVRVTDLGGAPREGLLLRVSGDPYERVQASAYRAYRFKEPPFEARTDADGRCVIEGLPPAVALTAELLEEERLLRRDDRGLRLEPGERRDESWVVGGVCVLEGRTLEADGRPAANVHLWLLPDDGGNLLQEHREDDTLARVRSDADGRFTLEVAAGSWLLGPRPGSDIAPVATRLEIAPEQREAEVTLTCWRGLFIRGTVESNGETQESGWVTAVGQGVVGHDSFHEGAFSIGPLPPGSYAVRARRGSGMADSEPRTVEAGTEGLVLVLRPGASLTVRVLDSSGRPVPEAMVWMLPEPGSEGGSGTRSSASGEVKFHDFLAGVYSLSASSPAREFGLVRGVTLASAREIELRLAPAGRLRLDVLPRPEPRMTAEVRLDGCPISLVLLGEDAEAFLEPGEYEVVLRRFGDAGPEEVERQRVRVTAEGEARVVFDLGEPR